ncbi:MAG: Hpt domain-containing protein [bacterium]|nr:Hpt domain-containing protein [bacterium]
MATSPGLIEEMREAMQCRQWQRLAELAHKFKSSAAIVGAEPLYEICSQLEAASEERSGTEALSHLKRVEDEYGRVRLSLEAREPDAEAI